MEVEEVILYFIPALWVYIFRFKKVKASILKYNYIKEKQTNQKKRTMTYTGNIYDSLLPSALISLSVLMSSPKNVKQEEVEPVRASLTFAHHSS